MISIAQNWRRYFSDHNEGIGTTYERFILNNYFEKIKKRYSIESILESPSFGMTGISGINSMWWAANGAQVKIMDDNEERLNLISWVWSNLALHADFVFQKDFSSLPFEARSFDMSWNFASLRFLSDIETFLKELTRVTKKVIFLCIPNMHNIFNMCRSSNKTDHSINNRQNDSALKIKHIMAQLDWEFLEEGYLDVPPWPDIAMAKEDMLRKMGFDFVANRLQKKNNAGICILDYFNGKDPQMETRILRYDFLENLPDRIKKFWAHHQYFIFSPLSPII
jgi:ubiquinone/menaquinone biosynthesis C-methylase UbiE